MIKKVLTTLVALAIVGAMAGCSNSDSSSSAGTVSDTVSTSSETDSAANSESEERAIQLYCDDIGPYYYNEDGTKTRIALDYAAQQQELIYDHYDIGGVSFDLPEGFCVNNAIGTPFISEDGDSSNPNNLIVASTALLMSGDYEGINKDTMSEILQGNVESGIFKAFTIDTAGEKEVNGVKTKTFKVEVEYPAAENDAEDDNDAEGDSENSSAEETESVKFYSEYTILDTKSPYFIAMNAEMNDEAIKKMQSARDYILDSIKIDVGEIEEVTPENEVTVDSNDNTYVFDMDDLSQIEEDSNS